MNPTRRLPHNHSVCVFRRHRGAILFVVGVLGALLGFCAADYGRRRARARTSVPPFDQQHREAIAAQQQAHAAFDAYKDSRR